MSSKGILTLGNCCEDCKHLRIIPLGMCEGAAFECWHPSNLRSYYNWLHRWQRPTKHPRKLNRWNSCDNFHKKEDK